MQRYFVSKIEQNQTVIFSKSDSYHIQKVMRMEVGEQVEVVYGGQTYLVQLTSVQQEQVIGTIQEVILEDVELSYSVYLVQSLVKEQKMDFILQKSCELGVAGIYPFQAERSVVKVTGKEEKKLLRWQNILKEASEQSKRSKIPFIEKVLSLQELLLLEEFDYKFICTVNEKEQSLKKVLSSLPKNRRVLFVVGPEGGFSEREEEALMKKGFVPISLGKSVLRTETAGLFFLSVMRYIDME